MKTLLKIDTIFDCKIVIFFLTHPFFLIAVVENSYNFYSSFMPICVCQFDSLH